MYRVDPVHCKKKYGVDIKFDVFMLPHSCKVVYQCYNSQLTLPVKLTEHETYRECNLTLHENNLNHLPREAEQ